MLAISTAIWNQLHVRRSCYSFPRYPRWCHYCYNYHPRPLYHPHHPSCHYCYYTVLSSLLHRPFSEACPCPRKKPSLSFVRPSNDSTRVASCALSFAPSIATGTDTSPYRSSPWPSVRSGCVLRLLSSNAFSMSLTAAARARWRTLSSSVKCLALPPRLLRLRLLSIAALTRAQR